MKELIRFDQDMDGSMESSENGNFVYYSDALDAIDEVKNKHEGLLRTCRQVIPALAFGAERNKAYDEAYQLLSNAIQNYSNIES